MSKFASVVPRRRWILAGTLVAACLILPFAGRVEQTLDVAARVQGSESSRVSDILSRRFGSPFAQHALLIVTGVPSPDSDSGGMVLRAVVDSLALVPGVTRTLSWLDAKDTLFLARNGNAGTFVVVGLTPDARADVLVESLRVATQRFERALNARHPGIMLRWTGEIALNADIRRASAADVQRAEWRVLPVTLLLLVLAFGAVGAALLPIAGAMLTIGCTLGVAAIITPYWPLSILLQNMVTMLGLGLGVDYSLLMVSRFRDERAAGRTSDQAATLAATTTGPTIALSGLAVAIGLGALTLTPVNELQSIAIGGLLIVGASVFVATAVLPGVLVMCSRFLDAGRVPLAVRVSDDRWRRWGRFVADHPGRVLILCGAPVCLLAFQGTRLRLDLPRGDWLPREIESTRALRDLEVMGHGAVVQTIRVVLELPANTDALGNAGWKATSMLAAAIAADTDVAAVRSLPGLAGPLGAIVPIRVLATQIPEAVVRAFVSTDGRAASMDVIPREGMSAPEFNAIARRLRALDASGTTNVRDARIMVGGLPAFNVDYQDAVSGRFLQVVLMVVAATFVVLAIGFRSVLVPLKAIVLNLLAVAGAFGAITVVFQDGVGASLLGLAAPLDGVFPTVPTLVFCTVFGLSMDYEVFLVARVREARQEGKNERDAIAEGLARTGGVITSAAVIMIAVFSAFTMGDFVLIKVLGFGLAVAVLLDATVMRLALSPALLALAGKWNWWPGEPAFRSQNATIPVPGTAPGSAT